MNTITLLLVIVVLAILQYVVPMNPFWKKLLYVVALVCLLFWLLGMFGVLTPYGLR